MKPIETITLVLECIAVASFSVTGTLIAIKRRLDIFGALVLALITSFGGGLIRDLTIGMTPPLLLSGDREYTTMTVVCVAVSLTVSLTAFLGNMAERLTASIHNILIESTDTLGLALFCILGIDSALEANAAFQSNPALLIFCGCITGVGGGILRDVMTAQIPSIFRKHIYLIPALLGSSLYVVLHSYEVRQIPAILFSAGLILILRFLAIRFRWNLPTPLGRHENDPQK